MVNQTQSLQLRQSQTLSMTQSMQQSLKILQLSTIDLAQYIEEEMEKNPLLEIEGDQSEAETPAEIIEAKEAEPKTEVNEKDSFDNLNSNEMKNNDNSLDSDVNADWNASDTKTESDYEDLGSYEQVAGNNNGEGDDAGSIIEKTLAKELSLKDFLLEQINVDFTDVKEKIIAEHLIDMVDGSGYLSSETYADDMVNLGVQLGCEVSDIETVVDKLQKCEPIGVCARSLKECLKIQLNDKQTLDPALERLVDNLEMLAKGELTKLQKICGVEADDLKEMIKEIKLLNPRPASGFSEGKTQVKIADLIVDKKEGVWQVELNAEILPKLSLRREYYNRIKANKLKKDEKKYVSENYNSANSLIRAIGERFNTMLVVGSAIIKNQEEFLDKGINYLKPISMKDIADEVGLHESTIGRVVANKYIATPRGVYEMRYFFTASLGGTHGDTEFSTETAKHQIKELIDGEQEILSDDDIAHILKSRGIVVARRTVAKYREGLNIPTSAVRKRIKKING